VQLPRSTQGLVPRGIDLPPPEAADMPSEP
jgi:hypothetical protein